MLLKNVLEVVKYQIEISLVCSYMTVLFAL